MTEKQANPKSRTFWLYCKHLCLWLIPCRKIGDLLPDSDLSPDALQDYWTVQYELSFGADALQRPKWVRAYDNKYKKDDETRSTSTHSDSDHESVINNEGDTDTGESVSPDSSDEDMDPDLRATRANNAFYQNSEDQLHFRHMEYTAPDLPG